MLEILIVVLCFWLFFKILGLAFRMAWGTAKIAVSVLMTIGSILLVCCLLFAGGILILIPTAILGIAFGIVKACT